MPDIVARHKKAFILSAAVAILVACGGVVVAGAIAGTNVTRLTVQGTGTNAKTATMVVPPGPAGVTGATSAGALTPAAPAMLAGNVPVPVGPSVLSPTNAWIASTRNERVVVYAGSSGQNSSDGRFVIVRQTASGTQAVKIVNLPGTGPVSITPPLGSTTSSGATVESLATSAITGSLSFTATSGKSGNLNLSNDTASTK